MKYLVALGILFLPLGVSANVDDTSIIDALGNQTVWELSSESFQMKSFDSCAGLESEMEKYVKLYYENNNYYDGRIYATDDVIESVAPEMESNAQWDKTANVADGLGWVWGASEEDVYETNTQVLGVDEADSVKTDSNYIYYFNQTKSAVYIADAKNMQIVKKILFPETISGIELFLDGDTLVIIGTGYSNSNTAKWYYFSRNVKTYSIVFDISDRSKPELLKLYSNDGSYKTSRKIGDMVYIVSQNYFDFPYYNWKSIDDIDLPVDMLIPRKLDVTKTDNVDDQNLEIKNTSLPYRVEAGKVAECENISYLFPDEETLKNTEFNPGYVIISALNISDIDSEVQTQVIAGSNNEIHMSLENIYLTEGIYHTQSFPCPVNAMCIMPRFIGGTEHTLVHKLALNNGDLQYKETSLVPGSPLTQYSMDEHEGNFRIITSQWGSEPSTGLYILDENLEKVSALENLAPGEQFQASRFIGDKLFLVTFEQIDPLFAIDLSDEKNPSILWELKIPGYSTYLHPYDENHLIGLGYATETNQWGGTQNAGLKVDLYKINYDKKCGDSDLTDEQIKKCESGDYKGIIVEQLDSETIGGKGSYSEALNNPRMFVWNGNKKELLLPATIYEKDDNWNTKNFYDGLFAFHIDAESGVDLIGQVSHVDETWMAEKREEECSRYAASETSHEPVCRELLNGEISCSEPVSYNYIPNYCYKDVPLAAYIGDRIYEYQDMMMKRATYIGDTVYGISDSQIGSYSWELAPKSSVSFQ